MNPSDSERFYGALGARIKELRGSSVTQEDLANYVGLSRVSLIKIESGRQKLLLHHAIMIADLLGLSLSELVDPMMQQMGEELDLSDAGDAAHFVRTALNNLAAGNQIGLNL